MSYRGRLTEAARDRIRAGGTELSAAAWLLDAEQVNELVVDDVDVDVTSTSAFLRVACQVPDGESADGVARLVVTLSQAEALQILFASQLDETRALPVRDTDAGEVEPRL